MRRILLHLFLAMLPVVSFAAQSAIVFAQASVLSAPRRINISGNQLVAFGPAGKRIWEWSSANPITDAVIGWRGDVYVSNSDGSIFALGPGGREVWRTRLNGADTYVQVERYGADGLVARVDHSSYRERFNNPRLPDSVSVFRRNEYVRSVEIPASARLVKRGSHFYAVYRKRGRLRRLRVL